MSKDDRNPVNPFTGKKHFDNVNDDEFLNECYNIYYQEINRYQLLDETEMGKSVFNITSNIVHAVGEYLTKINRYDYVDGYYDWEVHLVNSEIVNACCYPGGKIIVYSGILSYMQNADELAFVLAHEVSHALLDHSRTQQSVEQTKNSVSNISWMGSFALDMLGFGEVGNIARAAINVADAGSHYFLTQPWGRDHELEADKLGLIIAYLSGYDVNVVPSFWERFSASGGNDFDFFSTHPSDEKRIAVMKESLNEISMNNDFYSRPVLPETPKAKKEYAKIEQNFIPKLQKNQEGMSSPASNNNVCSNCGNPIGSDDSFCNNCGSKIVNDLYCTNCGNKVEEDDVFCTNCGKKL